MTCRCLTTFPRQHNEFARNAGSMEGLVAEWLRRGLQILAPRFDSGRGLQCPDFSAVALERQVPVE